MKKYAIIVAGGSGSRMASDIPKQFLLIHEKPILVHTIQKFLACDDAIEIILVLSAKDFDKWEAIKLQYFSKQRIITVAGGSTRFQSVRNGLAAITATNGLVAVHDAVRPCIQPEIILKSYHTAQAYGSAVASILLKDSVRLLDNNGESRAIDRNSLRLIQTPQTFLTAIIKVAYQQEEQSTFTDCASVVEAAGYTIKLIDGAYENIKITTLDDLILAKILLDKQS